MNKCQSDIDALEKCFSLCNQSSDKEIFLDMITLWKKLIEHYQDKAYKYN